MCTCVCVCLRDRVRGHVRRHDLSGAIDVGGFHALPVKE